MLKDSPLTPAERKPTLSSNNVKICTYIVPSKQREHIWYSRAILCRRLHPQLLFFRPNTPGDKGVDCRRLQRAAFRGRHGTGQQVLLGHLSPGLWLCEVMRCVCERLSQGRLPVSGWKKKKRPLGFLFSTVKGRCTGRRHRCSERCMIREPWLWPFINSPHTFWRKREACFTIGK